MHPLDNFLNPLRDPGLLFILILAGGLSCVFAWIGYGYHSTEEIVWLLEPLAHKMGFGSYLTATWRQGFASSFPIDLAYASLQLGEGLGIQDPLAQTRLLKIAFSLFRLSVPLAVWLLLEWQGVPRRVRLGATAIVALWPATLVQSTFLLPTTLAAGALAWGMILLFYPVTSHRFALWLAGAAGSGLGLFFHVQMSSLLVLPVLVLGLGLTKVRAWRTLGFFTLSYFVSILFFSIFFWPGGVSLASLAGMLNGVTHHFAYLSLISEMEVFPWYSPLSALAEHWGVYGLIPLLGLLALNTGRRLFLIFFLSGLLFLSLCPDKDPRFLDGFAWLLPLASASALTPPLLEQLSWRGPRSSVLWAALVFGVAGAGVSAWKSLPVLDENRALVRHTLALGKRLESLPDQTREYRLVLEFDPDSFPGGFYLRHPGKLCYAFLPPAEEKTFEYVGSCPRSYEEIDGFLLVKPQGAPLPGNLQQSIGGFLFEEGGWEVHEHLAKYF